MKGENVKMKRKFSVLIIALFMVFSIGLSGCTGSNKVSNNAQPANAQQSQGSSTQKNSSSNANAAIPSAIAGKNLKLFVISEIGGDDFTAQYLAGAKQEGESMGFAVDTYSANGDNAKFHDAIAQALQKGYDGFIISHGDDAATVDDVNKIVQAGKPVVSFDSNLGVANIKGVTVTEQDDESMALNSMKKLIQDHNGKANIIYLWVDGFPPMVNRNRMYKAMLEKYPGIKEVARFGVAAADTPVQTQNAVAAMLQKYPKGSVDAIFACWDAFAEGATRAVTEAGRSEIKVYGIDISNTDIQLMQTKNSPWVSTAACDPKLIAATDVRIALKKIAGEDTPQYYDIQPSYLTNDELQSSTSAVNMQNIANIVQGWGTSTAFEEPWMDALKAKKGK
jgi:simple sugar transport system substrate-binding protein